MTQPKRASLARRLLVGALFVAAFFVLVLVTAPWWWPYAARGFLARQGASFSRFETLGYRRVVLHDVLYATSSVEVRVKKLEAETPLVWLWNATFSQPGPLKIGEWDVHVLETKTKLKPPSAPSSIDGWPALRTLLGKIFAEVPRWLPAAEAGAGAVRWDKHRISASSLHWTANDCALRAEDVRWRGLNADAEARWDRERSELYFSATTRGQRWGLTFQTAQNNLTGQVVLLRQPVALQCTYAEHGWLPATGELVSKEFSVAASELGLAPYYTHLDGGLNLHWQRPHFRLDLHATSAPAQDQPVPPLELDVSGQGDASELQLETCEISIPGAKAQLLAPIVFDRAGNIRSGPSQFSIDANLARLPGADTVRGIINGRVLVEPSGQKQPKLSGHLEATDVTFDGFEIKKALIDAVQENNVLNLKEARLAMANGSSLALTGNWDWAGKICTGATLTGDIKRGAFSRWLPASLTFSELAVSARAEGRWPELKHSGTITLTDLTAGLRHAVSAKAHWEGVGRVAEVVTLEAKTGKTSFTATGALAADHASIHTGTLILAGAKTLQLAKPADIVWQPALNIRNLLLTGDDARLELDFSRFDARQAKIDLAGFDTEILQDFLPPTLPRTWLDSLSLNAAWPEGIFTGTVQLHSRMRVTDDHETRLVLTASAQPGGIHLDRLSVTDGEKPVFDAEGMIPIQLTPLDSSWWKLNLDGTWALHADTAPQSAFWAAQTAATGLTLRAPKLAVVIEGPVKEPHGRIEVQAEEISSERFRLPVLTHLDARLIAYEDKADLEHLTVVLGGKQVSLSAHTTIDPSLRTHLIKNPALLWSGDAQARLQIPEIELTALGPLLPDSLSPVGTIACDLVLHANGETHGTLKVAHAATRPVDPFGKITMITGDLAFAGRKAELRSLTALASGQEVQMSGSLEFPRNAPRIIDISLSGKNLPLARQSDLLIRGDLDLKVKSDHEGVTTLGGKVNLHDCLFFRDVRSLIPSRGSSPSSRPPYFSVTTPPFRDWKLALAIGGDRFIKLRTPIFNGVVSGEFNLTGTLFEPIAVGEVTIQEGVILLPFSSLRLTTGAIRLMPADPYTPQISVAATTRMQGYDIRMDLGGTASAPTLQFSSQPALTSDQILLMVMAGESPRSDVSYSNSQRASRISISTSAYFGRSLFSEFFGDPDAAERFTFSSGEYISESGKETYNVEYKINERWSLIGERDEFDDYNAGVKLRILTKKKADAAKP